MSLDSRIQSKLPCIFSHSWLFASFLLFPQHLRFLTGNPFLGGGGSSGVGAKREITTKASSVFLKRLWTEVQPLPSEYNRLIAKLQYKYIVGRWSMNRGLCSWYLPMTMVCSNSAIKCIRMFEYATMSREAQDVCTISLDKASTSKLFCILTMRYLLLPSFWESEQNTVKMHKEDWIYSSIQRNTRYLHPLTGPASYFKDILHFHNCILIVLPFWILIACSISSTMTGSKVL